MGAPAYRAEQPHCHHPSFMLNLVLPQEILLTLLDVPRTTHHADPGTRAHSWQSTYYSPLSEFASSRYCNSVSMIRCINNMLGTSPITSTSTTTTPTPATILARSSGSAPNVRPIVLLVEDDNYVSAAIWTLLQDSNFDVIIAASAAEGLKLVKTLLPDIVVLDVGLPDMNGVEICRRLKTDPRTAGLPVVFFSAQSQFAEEALDLGAKAFLVKPNDIIRLADCLTQVLSSRATAQMPQNQAHATGI